ncbi:Hint domain-containing protein [Commensalibacter oyaizuii]|uniref:Hint domain-containing protein n=1 Tax=Commensalibacter oyaizuii TaxID=3043873 RepID=A0ABT6Q1F7_9PROT|nr:Hint domain-containing protein [Commensalibacter sp. TBRC 16381]MDI2090813.1 Hint domain-containing protein [Commensalibacter sp. TBRC 16381]
MSDDNNKNNTSSVDQVATAVATVDDSVSSSLNDALLGSATISNASLTSGVTSGGDITLGSMASALGSDGSALISAYSAAAMSTLDQTYYGGSLNRAAALATGGQPDYNIVLTRTAALHSRAISNAPNVGDTYKYTYNASQTVSFYAGVGYNGSGNAVYQTTSAVSVMSNGMLQVGGGNSMLVGSANAPVGQADLSLQYKPTADSPSLQMDGGSYLSANGYVGGVADKSLAGQSVTGDNRGQRTGNVLTADNVSADVGGDWGVIGDADIGYAATTNRFGNNNSLNIGGTFGVFMNASATFGSNLQMNLGATTGSGLFVGSGASFSAGFNNQFHITGGMGAAYSAGRLNQKARLYLGDNNSVFLDQANWGNFAAQIDGIVSTGNNLQLRALEISVGYPQDPFTGNILVSTGEPAQMIIGNNANISLGQSGLHDNGSNFYLGSDGAIVVDASAASLQIGTGATIDANNISIGNFAKDYSGSYLGSTVETAAYKAGLNNSITIGNGASINLSGGVQLDGNNNSLTLQGSGILNAGGISAGRFYKEYNIGVGGGISSRRPHHVYDNTSGANVQIGDGYVITLTSGTIDTGLANMPTISNNGNLENNAQGGIFNIGNDVQLNANSVVLGDYSISRVNQYVGSTFEASAGTSNANITFGTNAHIHLSGSVLLNGSGNTMAFGDGLLLSAAAMSFGYGATGIGASNVFSVGNNASIGLNNGFIDNLQRGTVTFGDTVTMHLSGGNFSVGGISTTALNPNTVTFGANGQLILDNGDILITNSNQKLTFGSSGTLTGNQLSLTGTVNQSVVMNDGATVTLNGGIIAAATGGTLRFGNNANVTLGSDLTFTSNTAFSVGANGSTTINGNININATGTTFSIGANQHFTAGTIGINISRPTLTFASGITYNVNGWVLNGTYNQIALGNGASGSIGDITVNSGATNATFNTGAATNLTFGNANFANGGTFTINAETVTGTSLTLGNNAIVNVAAGTKLNLDTLVMDGTTQVTLNVASGAVVDIGSLVTTNVGSTRMPKIVINGATVIIDGQEARAAGTADKLVDFNNVQNGIYQYNGDISEESGHLNVTNFALNDSLVFEIGSAYLDQTRYVTSVSGGILTISYNNPDGSVTQLAQFGYTGSSLIPNVLIVESGASSTGHQIIITKCFLTGTNILTPTGEVTVESLSVGDEVVALKDGQQVSKRIVWIGSMNVNVNGYEHKDALYPVRIKAHAFGLNQPCRDLLVTPEHTIYVDGGLIPARMLVNGRSIIIDNTMESFTVYHVETEEHSILLSENLTTESYLNTDDRHLFNGDVANLHLTFDENAGHKSWQEDAAAPLTVARHQVEPIWQRLDRRATQQGYAPVSTFETTRDPELCLITQRGERLQPVDIKGNVYSFYVPANVSVVAMHSKAAVPSEVVGPFLDDRRMLGVLVAKISVFGERTLTILPSDMSGLSGWHDAELNRSDRWTKGLATLPEVISEMSNKVKLVKIELTATAEYFVDNMEFVEKIA